MTLNTILNEAIRNRNSHRHCCVNEYQPNTFQKHAHTTTQIHSYMSSFGSTELPWLGIRLPIRHGDSKPTTL